MLLIFDWDGTLADSEAHIVAAMQRTIADMDLPAQSAKACASCIGLGLRETALLLFPALDEQQLLKFRDVYSANYLALGRSDFSLCLFNGVRDTLGTLAALGHRLAIATGKSRAGLDRVLGESGLGPRFEFTRAADETASKPHPLMLEEILRDSGFDASQSLMIGDSTYDMEMAAAIDMPRIGVSYGVHAKHALQAHSPRVIIDEFAELLEHV